MQLELDRSAVRNASPLGRVARILGRGALLVTALLAFGVSTAGALAQSGRDIAPGPLTTARFERLARLYVAPTDDEFATLDRIHERYLDRFRTEIAPEIAALGGQGNEGMPTKDRFERLMRDADRIAARVAEADGAFLAAASEALPEAKRAGIERIKVARERQRLLAGVARFVPMSFGDGVAFIDLADLLARERYAGAVPEAMRPQFDSFMATQESRLLAQARSLNSAAREGMMRLFDLTAAMIRAAEPVVPAGATPEQEAQVRAEAAKGARERMRQSALAMKEIGAPVRKILRANHADNRVAGQQLAAIIGQARADEVREIAAARALGGQAYAFGMAMDENAQLALVAKRLKTDAQVAAEARERIDPLTAEWRGARATALEKYLAVIDEFGGESAIAALAAGDDAEAADAARAPVEAARIEADATLGRADARFKDALIAMLGTRVERYFEKFEPEEGEEGDVDYFVRGPEDMGGEPGGEGPDSEAGADGDVVHLQSFEFGFFEPMTQRAVLDALAAVGVDHPRELVEGTYDAWRAAKWDATVEPLNTAHREGAEKSYEFQESGGVRYDQQQIARVAEIARSSIAAVCDADEALGADLAGALGIAADSPAILLLRLEGLTRVSEAQGDPEFASETDPQTPSVTTLLEFARATPEEARAILAGSKGAWTALLAEIRPTMLALAGIDERITTMQAQGSPREREAVRKFSERYTALLTERRQAIGTLRGKLVSTFEAAYRAATEDPERRDAFARASVRAVFPLLYSHEVSAESALTAAMELRDIDETLRGSIEALRAEYIAVYDKITDELVAIASKAAISDNDDFAEYNRQMEAAEALRFQREERTAKAFGELRRLLGPARSARIPALRTKGGADVVPSLLDDGEDED